MDNTTGETTLTSFAGHTTKIIYSEYISNSIAIHYIDKFLIPTLTTGSFLQALIDDLNQSQPTFGNSSAFINDLEATGLLSYINNPHLAQNNPFKVVVLVPKNYAESKSSHFTNFSVDQLRQVLQYHVLLDFSPFPILFNDLYQLNIGYFNSLLRHSRSETVQSKKLSSETPVQIGFDSPGSNSVVKIVDGRFDRLFKTGVFRVIEDIMFPAGIHPTSTPKNSTWTYIGCLYDSHATANIANPPRTFQHRLNGSTYNRDTCLRACESNWYTYAGVEFAGECWCDTQFRNVTNVQAPATDCDKPCTSDPSQTCGSGNRLSAYRRN
ncbi:hypothetical protein HDU76_004593 [Blyttiomyces sp. JEL0837]|nr:hypothetical protein HDU76_004593 [Blyttiomyces sp. JEL0837]